MLIGALVVLAVIFIVIMVVNEAIIPPLIVFALVFAGLAYAVARWGKKRWVLIVATVLAALALISNVPFIVEDLTHPETAFSFIPTVISVLAAVVAVIAGLGAIFGFAPSLARPLGGAAVAAALVVVVVSGFATAGVDDAEAQPDDVTVLAEGVEYPETLAAPAGTVGFFLDNQDLIRHTFVIEGHDVKEELPGSSTKRVEVTLEPGEYTYICDVAGHERMEGVLTVS
ncbi:MAG: hypothetical protein GEU80_02550 [Dehalococcoidia bacterium]|nr:hypothetical protein [Dehalococcoidia bacterium]